MSKVLSVKQLADLSKNRISFKIMETFSFFIGIDISKATLDFAVVVANKRGRPRGTISFSINE